MGKQTNKATGEWEGNIANATFGCTRSGEEEEEGAGLTACTTLVRPTRECCR